MFASKKELEELKNKVKEQDNIINNISYHLVQLQQELNELKTPNEPNYFG